MNILVYSSNTFLVTRIANCLHNYTHYSYKTFQHKKDALNFICRDSVLFCVIEEDVNGLEFLTALRLIDEHIPILFVATKRNVEIKYTAFEKGADDCIDTDTSDRELYHRIQSLLKRSKHTALSLLHDEPISVGSSTIDFSKRHFSCKNQSFQLSKKEADLLKVFYLNAGKLLSRETILKEVWKTSDYFASKSMDVYLNKLRKILQCDDAFQIKNVHGTGYIFSVN